MIQEDCEADGGTFGAANQHHTNIRHDVVTCVYNIYPKTTINNILAPFGSNLMPVLN